MKRRRGLFSILGASLALSFVSGCSLFGGNSFTVRWFAQWPDPGQSTPYTVLLETDKDVKKGEMPHYDGDTPKRPETDTSTFVFSGWSPELSEVQGDIDYYAVFREVEKTVTVTWNDESGNAIRVDTLKLGAVPSFSSDGSHPGKEKDVQYTYTFLGWSKNKGGSVISQFQPVYEDQTYWAVFGTTVNEYTVTFQNYDGTELVSFPCPYGSTPVYGLEEPKRPGNEWIDFYPFVGWDKEVGPCTGPITYTAVFNTFEDPSSLFEFREETNGELTVTGFSSPSIKTNIRSFSVPAKVGEKNVACIDREAFSSCSILSSVVLPDSIKSIGYHAFSSCTKLASIDLGKGLQLIGSNVFYSCTSLTSIAFPASLQTMERGVLEASGVTEVTVPFVGENINDLRDLSYLDSAMPFKTVHILEGVQELSSSLTKYSASIDVYVPKSLTKKPIFTVRNLYFAGSLSEYINLPATVSSFEVQALWTKEGSEYVLAKDVTIPSTFASLPKYALSNVDSLESVLVPGNVSSIEDYAFYGCSNLKNAYLENGVTSIGKSAFAYTKLEAIELPASLREVKSVAFDYTNLAKVYVNAELDDYLQIDFINPLFQKKGYGALYFPNNAGDMQYHGKTYSLLEDLTIPDDITAIKQYAFYGCSDIRSIVWGSGLTSIGQYAFYHCSGLNSALELPSHITSIGAYGFAYTNITSVTADGVTVFDATFSNCYYLKNVHADALEEFNSAAFSSDNRLESISVSSASSNLSSWHGIVYSKDGKKLLYCPRGYSGDVFVPSNVEEIADEAFSGCAYIGRIDLPNGLKKIGYGAFANCSVLSELTIPDSVTSIEGNILVGCKLSKLTTPFVGKDVNTPYELSYFFVNKQSFTRRLILTDVCTKVHDDLFKNTSLFEVTVGDGVASLTKGCFKGATNLESVSLPFLGGSATENNYFSYLFGNDSHDSWKNIPASLRKVTIRGGSIIEEKAFQGCSNLTEISLPDTLTSIGASPFYNCTLLATIRVPFLGLTPTDTTNDYIGFFFGATSRDYQYNFIPESVTNIIIGNVETSISQKSFYRIQTIQSITLGDHVTTIDNQGFFYAYGLVNMVVPDNVTSIGTQAFGTCSALKTIDFGNGVASIPANVLKGSSLIEEVTIGENVTSIDYTIFGGATFEHFEKLNFNARNCPDPTSSYSYTPFYHQTALKRVVVGNNCQRIPKYLCHSCTGITHLTIGTAVTSIGASAFSGCTSLATIVCKQTTAYYTAISKGSNWHSNVPATTVSCTNGSSPITAGE